MQARKLTALLSEQVKWFFPGKEQKGKSCSYLNLSSPISFSIHPKSTASYAEWSVMTHVHSTIQFNLPHTTSLKTLYLKRKDGVNLTSYWKKSNLNLLEKQFKSWPRCSTKAQTNVPVKLLCAPEPSYNKNLNFIVNLAAILQTILKQALQLPFW